MRGICSRCSCLLANLQDIVSHDIVRDANHRARAEIARETDDAMQGLDDQDAVNAGLLLPDQPQIASYGQVRAQARADRKEADAEAKAHTAMLLGRTRAMEKAAFEGDSVARQSFVADARQMVTEFRRDRSLYPVDRVSDQVAIRRFALADSLDLLCRR